MSASRTGINFTAGHVSQGDPAQPFNRSGHETARGDSLSLFADAEPIGLSSALGELIRRNTPADFISNASAVDAERFELRIGEPQPTPFFNVDQLKAQGVVGLYGTRPTL